MRRSILVASAALASAMALAACLIDTSGLSGGNGRATPDGGGSDTGPPETHSETDGAAEAGMDAGATDGCVPVLSKSDAGNIVPLLGFDLLGTAAVDGNKVALTADPHGSQAGALWSSATVPLDHFDVTIGFSITAIAPKLGDGFGFAWVNQDSLPALGNSGAALAIDGLPGYGVVIDEYGEGYPVAPPVAAIVDLTKDAPTDWLLDAAPVSAPVSDGNEHSLRVTFDSGVVTVRVDAAIAIDHFTIAGYAPYHGRWGLGGGTGGTAAAHRITRVSFVDPSKSCP